MFATKETHFANLESNDQHTGGKWLIHGTKHRKDNQFKAWNSPAEYPRWEFKYDTRYSDGMSRGKNIQGGVHLQNQWNRIPSGNSYLNNNNKIGAQIWHMSWRLTCHDTCQIDPIELL